MTRLIWRLLAPVLAILLSVGFVMGPAGATDSETSETNTAEATPSADSTTDAPEEEPSDEPSPPAEPDPTSPPSPETTEDPVVEDEPESTPDSSDEPVASPQAPMQSRSVAPAAELQKPTMEVDNSTLWCRGGGFITVTIYGNDTGGPVEFREGNTTVYSNVSVAPGGTRSFPYYPEDPQAQVVVISIRKDGVRVGGATVNCVNDEPGEPELTVIDIPEAPGTIDDPSVEGDAVWDVPPSDDTFTWTINEDNMLVVLIVAPFTTFPDGEVFFIYGEAIDVYEPGPTVIDIPATPGTIDDPSVQGDAVWDKPTDDDTFEWTVDDEGNLIVTIKNPDPENPEKVFDEDGKTTHNYGLAPDVYEPGNPEPVYDPKAEIVQGDDCLVEIVLDNSGSNATIGFEVVIDGEPEVIELTAGEVRTIRVPLAQTASEIVVNALDAELVRVQLDGCVPPIEVDYTAIDIIVVCGQATFVNPEGNPAVVILYGDYDAWSEDGLVELAPGESTSVSTSRALLDGFVFVDGLDEPIDAFEDVAVPQDCDPVDPVDPEPTDPDPTNPPATPGAGGGSPTGSGGSNGWSHSGSQSGDDKKRVSVAPNTGLVGDPAVAMPWLAALALMLGLSGLIVLGASRQRRS